ncbi:PEP-CTERM system histidine kinase PrsK [Aestuariirhabdus sp. Z084]|uniref:XrtA/PEP-CTERM system histidine kinase PrsK n=1 Tax=Aestuariirhabdus haliotis TaxID=2918751 RepID=UPI00201B4340|nr:XrtA/PEP-CTERM system histidine kinase PrsK [Aestuariirhabdus haliotis]MCL6416882.1 PEP-CTERM system histidine kinase PrsK [Aestuariirhabdus haliotis]MCL6420899.1 PEP-CTERM system histidine kinase PrsK [Aestuariirhabdus haliotis]
MDFIIQASYGSLAAVYAVLLLLTFYRVSGELLWHFRALCLASILWAFSLSYAASTSSWLFADSWPLETVRNLVLTLLFFRLWVNPVVWPRVLLYVMLTGLLLLDLIPELRQWLILSGSADLRLSGHLVITITLLIVLEQVYAGVDNERRWAVKHFFLGLLAILFFDLVLYAEAVLYQHLNDALIAARGLANLLIIPLFILAGLRNPHWDAKLVVSHQAAFRTASLLLVGGYLLVVAIAGFYVRDFGGRWGDLLLLLLLFTASIGLFLIVTSGQLRSALSVVIAKHFFRLKYDYRDQWIKVTRALGGGGVDASLQDRCLKVMCDALDSRGALLWKSDGENAYVACGFWNMLRSRYENEALPRSVIGFLAQYGWVIDLEEYRSYPERYPEDLDLGYMVDDEDLWLIVPLLSESDLYGVVVLAAPRSFREIGWEDHDFIKLVAQQVSSYLSLADAHNALSEAKQFEAFNRVSAFVVHDLKNISAQLTLLHDNMKIHRNNPDFIDDCIDTISHATGKMDRMLDHLNGDSISERNLVNVALSEQVAAISGRFKGTCREIYLNVLESDLNVTLDEQRFSSAVENLIKNAVESAGTEGHVRVSVGVRENEGQAYVCVEDDGPGMTEEFVDNSLFHPFKTTKGNAGMGIGLFDAKEFMKSIGGDVVVDNRDSGWTRFTLLFPISSCFNQKASARGSV